MPQTPPRNGPDSQTAPQLPVEAASAHPAPTALARPCAAHVAEGDVLDRYSTVDTYAASFYTTGRYTTASAPAPDSGAGLAPRRDAPVPWAQDAQKRPQRAITEYQSLALMGKGRSIPLHRVDEYV